MRAVNRAKFLHYWFIAIKILLTLFLQFSFSSIAEIGSKCPSRNVNSKQLRRKDMKQRVLTELAPNGNLSCLLATADSDTALRTHFLYEIGGNIGK